MAILNLRKELILYSLFLEIPPQRTGMISALHLVENLNIGLGNSLLILINISYFDLLSILFYFINKLHRTRLFFHYS